MPSETREEFAARNEAARRRDQSSHLPHVRDGYIPCAGCGTRYHEMPDDAACPRCGQHLGTRMRSARRGPTKAAAVAGPDGTPPPGPHAATYAAAARGIDHLLAAQPLMAEAYAEMGAPRRAALVRAGVPFNRRVQRSLATQANHPGLRWGSDLLGGVPGAVVNIGAAFGDPADVDRARSTYDAHVAPYRDHADPTPAAPGEVDRALNVTPRTLGAAAMVAEADAMVAAHRRNRAEWPVNYWLNPLVASGPLSELGARQTRRLAALWADPDASRRTLNYLPVIGDLRALLDPHNAERRDKARGLLAGAVQRDELAALLADERLRHGESHMKKTKTAADLSPGSPARAAVPKSDFVYKARKPKGAPAGSGKGSYPISDARHARAALGFAAMHHGKDSPEYRAVAAKVHAKYPDMGKESSAADEDDRRRKPPLAAYGLLGGGAAGLGLGAAGGLLRHLYPVNHQLVADMAKHRDAIGAAPDAAARILEYARMGHDILPRPAVGGATGLDVMRFVREPSNPARHFTRDIPGLSLDWGKPWDARGDRLINDHYQRFAKGPAAAVEQLAYEHPDKIDLAAVNRGLDAAAGVPAATPAHAAALGGAALGGPRATDLPAAAQDAAAAKYLATPEGGGVAKVLDEASGPGNPPWPHLAATLYTDGARKAEQALDLTRYWPHAAGAGALLAGLGGLGLYLHHRRQRQREHPHAESVKMSHAAPADLPALARQLLREKCAADGDEPGLVARGINAGVGVLKSTFPKTYNDTVSGLADTAIKDRLHAFVGNNPWLPWAAGGLALGGGLGLVHGLTHRRKDKWKSLGDALTGGLLGAGALGLGRYGYGLLSRGLGGDDKPPPDAGGPAVGGTRPGALPPAPPVNPAQLNQDAAAKLVNNAPALGRTPAQTAAMPARQRLEDARAHVRNQLRLAQPQAVPQLDAATTALNAAQTAADADPAKAPGAVDAAKKLHDLIAQYRAQAVPTAADTPAAAATAAAGGVPGLVGAGQAYAAYNQTHPLPAAAEVAVPGAGGLSGTTLGAAAKLTGAQALLRRGVDARVSRGPGHDAELADAFLNPRRFNRLNAQQLKEYAGDVDAVRRIHALAFARPNVPHAPQLTEEAIRQALLKGDLSGVDSRIVEALRDTARGVAPTPAQIAAVGGTTGSPPGVSPATVRRIGPKSRTGRFLMNRFVGPQGLGSGAVNAAMWSALLQNPRLARYYQNVVPAAPDVLPTLPR